MADAAEEFDFIVTGAGSAGAVVAARLSESGRHRVLLLEAGPPDTNPWIHIPLGFARTYVDGRVNWRFESEPQPRLNNRRIYAPRGRTLGGTSSINGMVYMRGHPRDYDEWRQRGCTGWDWDSVLPFFRKAENQQHGANEFHGTGGPLEVSDQAAGSALADAMIAAAESLGIPRNPDFNGARQEGTGYYQTTTGGRRRWSAARAYLKPARGRPNLVIRTLSQATRVLIEGGRATGIEYHSPQGRRSARARREVIVSGGAYGSPQLLLLSGLGPAEHLRGMGIEVVRDMPAVGANLHDHFGIYLMWRCTRAITMNDLENSWPRKILAAAQYGLFRSGPMAVNGIRAGVFTRTDQRLERPDLQINLLEWSTRERSRDRVIPHDFPGFTLGPVHLAPDGRGTVRLASPDPLAPPAISFGFLHSDYDMRAMVAGVTLARAIAGQPAMRPFVAEEILPGPAYGDGADLERFVRENGVSNHHPTSSCAMGAGSNTVVDPRLRVHGIGGLRVADASIMPSVPAGNTNAPSIMVGEKAAAMILEDAD
ncbi:GMC family oxidoreductase [Roseicella aerolata]|uniref:GMC family oxidoreductase N-terminal domain-containing protein n=1 Tax=Roseicella aerolata TaxID=2883479 RepID=A0A9X1L711_9PROT|nr:GMC family oxidoreductase N-terminal domain-containing protein [Roseicella aerolata]MCB4821426.1 GMC family oxidoreductase N-terminal domain-containing protein [Roseicella aerolata]